MDEEIIKKIKWAEAVYGQYKETILTEKTIKDMAADLKQIIEKRKSYMLLCGVSKLCRECDINEGGSCCGRGMEARYDEWLLLINLLLGCKLPRKRREPNSCLFLERDGCLLKALHVICINYICKKIEVRISKAKLSHLRDIEGHMIATTFGLHEYLMKVFPWLWS